MYKNYWRNSPAMTDFLKTIGDYSLELFIKY